jgi:lysophospholipase L1-like esterase
MSLVLGRSVCSSLFCVAILGACDRGSEPKPESVAQPLSRSAPVQSASARPFEPAQAAPPRPVERTPRAAVTIQGPAHPLIIEEEPGLPAMPPAAPAALDAPESALTKMAMPPGAKIYPKNIANRPVPRVGDQPWAIAEDWRARHERQLKSPKRATAKVIFLGDSIVDGWGSAPAFRDQFGKYTPLNLGIAGDYTQNVLWRIEHGALEGLTPGAMVVLVGVNNLAGGFTPEQTAAGVAAVVDSIQARLPSVPIVLLSILPARRGPSDPLRRKITEVNLLLGKLAKPGRVSVHDVGSVLLEPDGSISPQTSPDALHPTAAGYERLTAAVAPLIEKLVPL